MDRPGAQQCLGTHIDRSCIDEGNDLAGVFAAYPASFVSSDPHRLPGPGCVDHLHHHAPVALCDHPTIQPTGKPITGLYIENQSFWGASRTHLRRVP